MIFSDYAKNHVVACEIDFDHHVLRRHLFQQFMRPIFEHHGVDVMFEDRPHELLKEMTAKRVMVEINLTSNDMILGIIGKNHPLPMYRQFGVPVALSTDDEGVSRIDLTNEYVRAVETYDFKYADLKRMARTGL